jgi:hypothetical protein
MSILKFSNKLKFVLGVIFWSLIIAIPQFTYNYTTGLLSGKLSIGQTPVQFYLGLISGAIFGSMFYFVLRKLTKLFNRFRGKNIDGYDTFFIITGVLFLTVLLLQGNNLYVALTLKEQNVRDAQELIKSYNNK